MLLNDARREARVGHGPSVLVLLADQDRAVGTGAHRRGPRRSSRVARGATSQVRTRSRPPSPRCTRSAERRATDWAQIAALYEQLLRRPGPVVALNRAVAVAEIEGPEAGLAAIEGVQLKGYHLLRRNSVRTCSGARGGGPARRTRPTQRRSRSRPTTSSARTWRDGAARSATTTEAPGPHGRRAASRPASNGWRPGRSGTCAVRAGSACRTLVLRCEARPGR